MKKHKKEVMGEEECKVILSLSSNKGRSKGNEATLQDKDAKRDLDGG